MCFHVDYVNDPEFKRMMVKAKRLYECGEWDSTNLTSVVSQYDKQ